MSREKTQQGCGGFETSKGIIIIKNIIIYKMKLKKTGLTFIKKPVSSAHPGGFVRA